MSSTAEKNFSILIEALGMSAGVPGVTPGTDGVFRMEAGDRLLSIIPQGDSAVLFCSLGRLPAEREKADAVRTALLSANVLYRGSFGACLGAAPEDGVVSLCFQTPMHAITAQGFVSLVENFLTLADLWEKRLEELAADTAQAGTPAAGEAAASSFMNDPLMRA